MRVAPVAPAGDVPALPPPRPSQSTEALGKPQGQDLASGNLTAPALFALQHPVAGPQLLALIQGRFREPGSLDEALLLVDYVLERVY